MLILSNKNNVDEKFHDQPVYRDANYTLVVKADDGEVMELDVGIELLDVDAFVKPIEVKDFTVVTDDGFFEPLPKAEVEVEVEVSKSKPKPKGRPAKRSK